MMLLEELTKTRTRRGATITAAYLALALAMSYPLVFNLRSFAMAGSEDGPMSIWNIWWMKFSLIDLGANPLESSYIFFPDGVSLAFHSIPKVLGLVGIPLQMLAGITLAYNLIFISTFVLTGVATYWLVHYLTGARVPAFLAGALFAFCPYRWDHIGHLQLLSTMLMPVYVLLLFQGKDALKEGGRRAWVRFALAGLTLAAIGYDTEYYAIFLGIFTGLFFLAFFPPRLERVDLLRWGKLLIGLALALALAAVLFTPMLLAAANELDRQGDYITFSVLATVYYSADILDFFVPQAGAQFLGPYFDFVARDVYFTDTIFLGWMALLLALAGLWSFRRRREVWLWAGTAAVFAALALGPNLIINGKVKLFHGPYLYLTNMPVVNAVRVPSRFGVMVIFAVAVLAAYGAAALLRLLSGRGWSKIAVPVAAVLLLAGMFIEFKPVTSLNSTRSPAVYEEIAASDATGSVITLPLGWEGGPDRIGTERTFTELFQMVHRKPMVGGMLARVPREQLFRGAYAPVIGFLADPERLEPSDLDRDPAAIAWFNERYQADFIVAHKVYPELYYKGSFYHYGADFTPAAIARVDAYVTEYLDMEKFAETDEIVAYRRR